MKVLLDTNILTRLIEPGHAMHPDALNSTRVLGLQGHSLCIVPQNLYEFWVVCTRPLASNGLGKSVAECTADIAGLKGLFALLDDTPALYPTWEQLVTANAVVGKNAHDARLVAAMQVHGITHLLTFNDADFRRFTAITVFTPTHVLAPTATSPPPPPGSPPTP